MIDYRVWGDEGIDEGSRTQIENACALPISRKAALMPDAHLGYGLPIGGVLATENAVVPYGVGQDIACRMRLTMTNATRFQLQDLDTNAPGPNDYLDGALRSQTHFGVGCAFTRSGRRKHPVMDDPDWRATVLLRDLKDRAWEQLGTSGSGNHFVEWGIVFLFESVGTMPKGSEYVALLSHSGSRGTGAKVCTQYTRIAKKQNPAGELSWLDLDSEAGEEYWMSMNLMGEYAAANHECIHEHVLKAAGLGAVGHVENHHNFAWEEDGLIVHRKGATPAGLGELGVIPGSMATPAYIVRGKGNPDSINSASHGAGRAMSRKEAKRRFNWDEWADYLAERRVRVLSAGLDEVPGSYKDIDTVMAAQADLVEVVGVFEPRIVMMSGGTR